MDNQEQLTMHELIDRVMPCIIAKRYKKTYIKGFRNTFDRLIEYCDERGIEHFSTELGEQFLRDCYNVTPGTVERRCSRLHRTMDLLSDFLHLGTVMIRRRLNRTFPIGLQSHAEAYLKEMKDLGRRKNTILSHQKLLFKFTDFLDSIGIVTYEDITADTISRFIKVVLCNYSFGTANAYFRILRSFVQYLSQRKIVMEDLVAQIVSVKTPPSPTRIPTTFTVEQIRKILAAVDRESPRGKRDYAVLIIATKLGMRVSDIRNLKPSNFDWERHTVSFVQIKTGEPLTLPLPIDVGWAVIDYLKNGRPPSEAEEIFVRAVAPYDPLTGLDFILETYMHKAGIRNDVVKHHGLHALRHSLATHMLDEKVPLTSIQSVLGHVNAEATQKYLGVNVAQLRSCAMEVPNV